MVPMGVDVEGQIQISEKMYLGLDHKIQREKNPIHLIHSMQESKASSFIRSEKLVQSLQDRSCISHAPMNA